MAAWLDRCRFIPISAGTTDWVVNAPVPGYQTPALAGVSNARVYKFVAESDDLTQWEICEGAYTTGTNTFARTTVLYNSSGTGTASGQSGAGTKINFTLVPKVAIVAVKEDMISIEEANAFTAAQQLQACNNIDAVHFGGAQTLSAGQKTQAQANVFSKAPTVQNLTSGSGATYTTPAGCLWLEVFIVGGAGGGGGASTTANTWVAGGNGTASTFNSVNANPGLGPTGTTTGNPKGGLGGTGGTGTATLRTNGSDGFTGYSTAASVSPGGQGGHSQFKLGGAQGQGASTSAAGIAGGTNTGGGGSGSLATGANNNCAAGGGGGETAYLIINAPAATYTYTVGAGGAGGVSSTTGGAGGTGVIVVIEHYQ